MGELSRLIGEQGENIIIKHIIPHILGWRGASNLGFACNSKKQHEKLSHDIDAFATYESPLIADNQDIIYCSIKNTESRSVKSDFKKFAESIAQAAECFIRNQKYAQLTSSIIKTKRKHSLVLFWLNHKEEDDFSLLKGIGNSIISELNFNFERIFLVDNKKVNFLYSSLLFVKSLYPNDKIDYFYHQTGINETIYGGRKLGGKELPIELVNSSIIPFRIIVENDRKILVLVLNELFDEDSLKRLMGLAQNLTSGWCNKIILAFPDFRSKDHNLIKDNVMLKFRENNFADMVEIRSFRNSFKQFEQDETVNFVDAVASLQEFNIEKMLPFGDQMRQLLVQSYINKTDIQTLLARRGVYVNKSLSKEELIPYLTTTLISPSEFEFLRKKQNSKTNAESISTEQIATDKDTNISELILAIEIPIENIIKKINPNIEITKQEPFYYDDDGCIRCKIETKHSQLTKEWAMNNTNHHCEIIIRPHEEKGDYCKSRIDIVGTSKESKEIAKNILDCCVKTMQEQGNLRKDITLERTLANEFDNINRAKLLFSFTNISKKENEYIVFKDITHVEFFVADDKNKLPEDIETLKDKVKLSIFSGSNLHGIKYITDEKYYQALVFTSINAEFEFSYKDTKGMDIKGLFEVTYGFSDFKTKQDEEKADFEFKITDIKPIVEKNLSKKENHDVKIFLQDQFNELKWKKIKDTTKKYGSQLALKL